MSRLSDRLRQMETQADPKRRAERESHNLAGDGLEMAARVALEAWQERPRHPDESDVFRLGYRLACHELAMVFRAMRKGEPPSKAEFQELRRLVFEDAAAEQRGDGITDTPFPSGGTILRGPGAPEDCTPAPDCAEAGEDAPSADDEAPDGYCLDHGGPHPCGSCGQGDG